MVRKLVEWAVSSPLIVLLLTLAMAVTGSFAFANINVEAYPDPAPAIIEVIAQWPGASAEEMERQVTVPLEVVESPQLIVTAKSAAAALGLASVKLPTAPV